MNQESSRLEEFVRRVVYPRAFSSEDRRRGLIKSFRKEIVLVLLGLRSGKIIGQNTEPLEVPDQCDFCATPIAPSGVYVDGMTNQDGRWAYMCVDCFTREGEGIGWGIGQLYAHDGEKWQCIGGGDPTPAGSD